MIIGNRFSQFPLDETDIRVATQHIFKDGAKWGKSHNWYWKGLRSHWRLLGEDNHRPLLLLHGFGGDLNNWLLNQSVLADKRTVYAFDLPGHGSSTKRINEEAFEKVEIIPNFFKNTLNLDTT